LLVTRCWIAIRAILYSLRRELERDPSLQVCGEAVDGADAIVKANELHPDLIILDLTMPRMSGLEAAREIAKVRPGIPMLLFTLSDTPGVRMQAASAGIHAVISKADGIKTLRAAIETALFAPQDPGSSGGVSSTDVVRTQALMGKSYTRSL
jgi:DNA-binding NarL/FixJ family response regulator